MFSFSTVTVSSLRSAFLFPPAAELGFLVLVWRLLEEGYDLVPLLDMIVVAKSFFSLFREMGGEWLVSSRFLVLRVFDSGL